MGDRSGQLRPPPGLHALLAPSPLIGTSALIGEQHPRSYVPEGTWHTTAGSLEPKPRDREGRVAWASGQSGPLGAVADWWDSHPTTGAVGAVSSLLGVVLAAGAILGEPRPVLAASPIPCTPSTSRRG
jgi:hypothetical protein